MNQEPSSSADLGGSISRGVRSSECFRMRILSRMLFGFLSSALVLIVVWILLYGAARVPVHWDEGWNLCIARNWYEVNHYGCKLRGAFTTARLSTGWLPVYLTLVGFRWFGESFVSGRIVFGILCLMYLASIFFFSLVVFRNRWTALFATVIAAFLSPDTRLNPLLLAGQSYAEVASMAALAFGALSLHFVVQNESSLFVRIICVGLTGLFFRFAVDA
ncbi:MAG: hypothetical protein KDD60_01365, partial [Bdellovibrionales bacterium]|nr:hypothetical protein [Bdellovibrionales bacterium]